MNLAILNVAAKVLQRIARLPPLRNSVFGCGSKVSDWGCGRGRNDPAWLRRQRPSPSGGLSPVSGPGPPEPLWPRSRLCPAGGAEGGERRGRCAAGGAARAEGAGPRGRGAARKRGRARSAGGRCLAACAMRGAAERGGRRSPAGCGAFVRCGAAARVRSPRHNAARCGAHGGMCCGALGNPPCAGMPCGPRGGVRWDVVRCGLHGEVG